MVELVVVVRLDMPRVSAQVTPDTTAVSSEIVEFLLEALPIFKAGILNKIVKGYRFIILTMVSELATLHGEGCLPQGLDPRHQQGQSWQRRHLADHLWECQGAAACACWAQ